VRIERVICDVCYHEEVEDDAAGFTETETGRDLCPDCSRRFQHGKKPLVHPWGPMPLRPTNGPNDAPACLGCAGAGQHHYVEGCSLAPTDADWRDLTGPEQMAARSLFEQHGSSCRRMGRPREEWKP
jgi:hypothetical protein